MQTKKDEKNKIVIISGYMGSGSTAVTDLISEISGYDVNRRDYEYVLMHCPNGVFDLEDKLLFGNNALRSDEAIRSFERCMNDLYDLKHYWVGNYKQYISENFLKYVNEFIEALGVEKLNHEWAAWYYMERPTGKILIQRVLRKIVLKITFGKLHIKKPFAYKGEKFAYPTSDEFYAAAKVFLNKVYADLGYAKHNLVLDQFLLPHNLFRFHNYFDRNARVVVVDRDPRDVFLLNKYFWPKQDITVSFPMEAEQFCRMYRKMRKCERWIEDERIIRIHFEDLIYNYEESLSKIYQILNVTGDMHKNRMSIFDPRRSINNTQVYFADERYLDEAKYIERELGEYIYRFPVADPFQRDYKNIF